MMPTESWLTAICVLADIHIWPNSVNPLFRTALVKILREPSPQQTKHSLTHGPWKDWKRPAGRPSTTWLWIVE